MVDLDLNFGCVLQGLCTGSFSRDIVALYLQSGGQGVCELFVACMVDVVREYVTSQ